MGTVDKSDQHGCLGTVDKEQIRPDYYRCGELECFDILSRMSDDAFSLCNAVKYIFRAGEKTTELEDLRKALTCIEEGKKQSEFYTEANIRDVYQSELPFWKKRLIVQLMDMTRYDDGDYRKERYDVLIDEIRERIEHYGQDTP